MEANKHQYQNGQIQVDTIGGFPIVSEYCAGCRRPLLIENAWMTDGCPCNSAIGVNSMNETRWRLLMDLQQQQSRIIERLPRTADGHRIIPGKDVVYHPVYGRCWIDEEDSAHPMTGSGFATCANDDGTRVRASQCYAVATRDVAASVDPFRLAWASYFRARAAKSRSNGLRFSGDTRRVWFDKAMIEEECAMILEMTKRSLAELRDALTCDEAATASGALP